MSGTFTQKHRFVHQDSHLRQRSEESPREILVSKDDQLPKFSYTDSHVKENGLLQPRPEFFTSTEPKVLFHLEPIVSEETISTLISKNTPVTQNPEDFLLRSIKSELVKIDQGIKELDKTDFVKPRKQRSDKGKKRQISTSASNLPTPSRLSPDIPERVVSLGDLSRIRADLNFISN